jgi:hypothetical protein
MQLRFNELSPRESNMLRQKIEKGAENLPESEVSSEFPCKSVND